MPTNHRQLWREIVSALVCSRLYFELSLDERLALVKQLCLHHGSLIPGK
ncbi:MAG: hypothetical protein LDL07_07355 [Desulfarculus sp.]|nr:hypothetical protein [Desulfarculus sp.]